MTGTTTSSHDRAVARRRIGSLLLGFSLATLALSACAGVQSTPRDPNDKPFWEREEQRD